jgi:hypothetical protein
MSWDSPVDTSTSYQTRDKSGARFVVYSGPLIPIMAVLQRTRGDALKR